MKCSTSNIQLETVVSRIKNGTLNLQPDFQRGEVWSISKQKKLIDTILRRWTIPPIHVVNTDDITDEVLDGQQRLATIRDFCNGLFCIDGNIQPLNKDTISLDGLKFYELPEKVKLRFLRYEISFITLTEYEPSEPAELFDRLNQPMKLTSSEQRNAYVGDTRNQIKNLVKNFENLGASKETIGFSNSRLAYDEIIAKFCYTIEIKTLRQKIIASNISDKYRENVKFSDLTIITCQSVLEKFMSIVNTYEYPQFKLKMNKATIYSWFIFIKQNKNLSYKEIASIIYNFEILRDYFKGKILDNNKNINLYLTAEYFIKGKRNMPYLEAMINVFNQRASMGSTDALSIIYRDIILYVFGKSEMGLWDEVLYDFNKKAINSISIALEYIYTRYKWGEKF